MKEMVCKYCHDEFCVNDKCPMRGDYCPVPDTPGVCQHEERIEIQSEPEQRRLNHYECFKKAIDESGYSALDDSTKLLIYDVFCDILKDENWEIVDMTKKDEESDINEPKWTPGQFVGIEEISTSNDWVFERKIKDHDVHESIVYVSRDRTLIVSFDDENDYSTIMLNRNNNYKKQEKPKYAVGQKVDIHDIAKSDEWVFKGVKRYGSYEERTYVSRDKTMKVSFGDWDNCEYEYIQPNKEDEQKHEDEAFKVGNRVARRDIEHSKFWKHAGYGWSEDITRYVSSDGAKYVHFVDGNEYGIVGNVKTEFEFRVGERVHIGNIGASQDWLFIGEENDVRRYMSINKMLCVAFPNGSNWGTIMLNR